MASARKLAIGLMAAIVLGLLSGCGALLHQNSTLALHTPSDPPSIPARKPATPAWFQVALADTVSKTRLSVTQVSSIRPATAQRPASQAIHRVAPGETVQAIASRLDVPIRDLIAANRLQPPYRLLPGQSLSVPRPRVHQVVAGDTLYGIAQQYGTEMTAVARLNGIAPPYNIVRGQRLTLPARGALGPNRVQVATLSQPASSAVQVSAVAVEPLDGGDGVDGESLQEATSTALVIPARRPGEESLASVPIPQPPPLHGGKFLWPISGPVLSSYGPQSSGLHNDGVNISAARGTPIRAAENGVVAYVGNELRGFGNLLLIKHSGGWVTAYAHADEILVRRGQPVERGQVVARVGSSGSVSEPQLHFEVRKGVQTIDPARLLEAREVASN